MTRASVRAGGAGHTPFGLARCTLRRRGLPAPPPPPHCQPHHQVGLHVDLSVCGTAHAHTGALHSNISNTQSSSRSLTPQLHIRHAGPFHVQAHSTQPPATARDMLEPGDPSTCSRPRLVVPDPPPCHQARHHVTRSATTPTGMIPHNPNPKPLPPTGGQLALVLVTITMGAQLKLID